MIQVTTSKHLKQTAAKRAKYRKERDGDDRLIFTKADFRNALKYGRYSDEGGATFFVTADGGVLSFDAAEEEKDLIYDAIHRHDRTGGWLVVGMDFNYDDDELYCSHSGEKIECPFC